MKKNKLQKVVDSVENFFLTILKKIGLKIIVKWYLDNQETMRYLIFGGLSTLINVVIFMILDIFSPTIISNSGAWIFSVLFAYITNKYCVFDSKTSSKGIAKEVVLFVICRIITLIIDLVFMVITIDILHLNKLLMKIISNIIVIIINYILSKLLVFREGE